MPPRWLVEPTDTSVSAGQDVWLHCEAEGSPPPTVLWKKAVSSLPGEYRDLAFYEHNVNLLPNGTLHFARAAKESEGHYMCEAGNSVGSDVSKVVFLKVNGKHCYIHSRSAFLAVPESMESTVRAVRAKQPVRYDAGALYESHSVRSARALPHAVAAGAGGQGGGGPPAVRRARRPAHRRPMAPGRPAPARRHGPQVNGADGG